MIGCLRIKSSTTSAVPFHISINIAPQTVHVLNICRKIDKKMKIDYLLFMF